MTRPDWIACIKKNKTESVCGKSIYGEFALVNYEHARATIEKGMRVVPCEDCMKKFKAKMICRNCAKEYGLIEAFNDSNLRSLDDQLG